MFTREQSCQRREHSPVGGGVPGARDLATKYGELMTKHRDLDVLVVWGRTDSEELEQPSNQEEVQRIVHVNDRGRFKKPLVSARLACLHPSGDETHLPKAWPRGFTRPSRSWRMRKREARQRTLHRAYLQRRHIGETILMKFG